MSSDNSISAPLVVDLDGTLTPTDTLVESVIQLVKRSPLHMLSLPLWLFAGRSAFKDAVACRTSLAPEHLPYREALLAFLRDEKAKGRKIILATAAHRDIADAVARHLGVFDEVLASDRTRNLKGLAKLDAIRDAVGEHFVYAGDSSADLPIWASADAAVLVGVAPDVARSVKRDGRVEREFPNQERRLADWLRAMRVHQWIKNLLLFVPLLTAFPVPSPEQLIAMTVAFLALSLTASATYIGNDLLDLENDRGHLRKSKRPFASARLPITHGVGVALVLLVAGLGLAVALSPAFLAMLLLYLVTTSMYSWVLKRYVLLDVIVLSLLYTLRIFAGAIAVKVAVSPWLLAFSVFIFLSLALVKRCSELVVSGQLGRTAVQGRDYRVADLAVLWPLGVGASVAAVVVFGLFISAAETVARYAAPQILWFVAVGLIYWLGRLWIKTSRGEMHDDPVVYAVRDRGSCLTVLGMIVTVMLARFLSLGGCL
ncbi:UbiA family prenyltransferase [Zoogloea sp. LCSB751]|uniref:UbiA family prenyltransferase n=1 Tax=Zoogloea sp. LCSB751 TaxID=1965277 RepID=UPI0009A4B5DD|nr:UbiA family prenyltransferase [Zoogloea sp. LCSB751]